MLQLKLYPAEFGVLLGYLRFNTEGQESVPLQHQLVTKLVLLQYLQKWTPVRILAWRGKRANKAFSFRMPIVVGLSLYQDMKGALLTHHQQLLLDKLDQAIVNYRDPASTPHVIGELIQTI